ncbi:MAG: 2-oxo acid dehydrogenase subunit E2 [Gammaproteobacteria bacterium]|nr:2-oxo acid dehydrogenase subunit E2 [Gammaproteobacteria bacterium]
MNINDDIVLIVDVTVSAGDTVKAGDMIAEVETDKAVIPVEAEQDGYILKILCDVEERVKVGAVMMWIGDSPDEQVPEPASKNPDEVSSRTNSQLPTAKARALLDKHKLDVVQIPHQGERLTARDIEAFIAGQGGTAGGVTAAQVDSPQSFEEQLPGTPGSLRSLSAEEQGMVSTVIWHRDHAVAAYLEMAYDQQAWNDYAAAFAERHKFMLSPLLPLMAYRLVKLARDRPGINTTLVNGQKYLYDQVNLGFTVQVGETLYLTVVQQADAMDDRQFIDALGEVQRHAMAKKLRPEELKDATLGFSSMARWNVSRHVPVLAPYTALMVAHSAPQKGGQSAVLGASYDHRILSGHDVANVLQALTQPPEVQ